MDYRMFNRAYVIIPMCVRIHTGVGHTRDSGVYDAPRTPELSLVTSHFNKKKDDTNAALQLKHNTQN